MTVSSGFFNSVNHDRLYDAEQLSSIFDGIIIDGVYENYGEAFMVTANSEANSSVIIGTGRAWFDHTWTVNDSQFAMQLDPPNELLGRTDAIVLDIDRTQDVRKNSILYVKGSESSPEFPPDLVNESRHKQYPIAYITRHAEVNSPINQDDIQITVGTSDCPIVTGILESQNLENLMAQLDSEFNTWWDGIKAALDENVATNLQNQIDELKEKIDGDGALVGLLTKKVYDMYRSGNYNISSKSNAINIQHTPPNAESYDNLGSPLQQEYPYMSLLPDGKVLTVYVYAEGRSGSSAPEGACAVITNLDGVNQYTIFEYSDPYAVSSGYFWARAGMQVESYPVKARALHLNNRSSSTSVPVGMLVTFSISSQGTVQHSEEEIGHISNLNTYYYGTLMQTPTVSGTWLASCRTRNGLGMVTVTSEGVCSTHYTSVNGMTGVPSGYGGEMQDYVLGNNGYWLLKTPRSDVHYKINESDFSVETISGAPPSDKFYPIYGAETYYLSESSGFYKKEIKPRGSLSGETATIGECFVGASNLGDPLPEGAFIANKIGDTYVGLGSDGEQIALGSNGGLAILKQKKTGVSIDFSKIVTYLRGNISSGGNTYYLLFNTDPFPGYGEGPFNIGSRLILSGGA